MRNLRMRGGAAAAIVAAAAMVLSTFAIAPANAYADDINPDCVVSDQEHFEKALQNQNCPEIKVQGDKDGILGFGIQDSTVELGLTDLDKKEYGVKGYGTVAKETVTRPVTITSDSRVVMRNVQFLVPAGGDLTFAGQVVLDDAELGGIALGQLLKLGSSANVTGIDYGVKVDGGKFTLSGSSVIAVGVAARTTDPNRAIVVSENGSTVNLNSGATYNRSEQSGLAIVHLSNLTNIPLLNEVLGLLDNVLKPILGILSFNREADYPTVWGRDAAVYSEPNVTNAQINITDGSYLNKKDREPVNETTLNGAISTSATVNITGDKGVRISNLKLGNGVDSSHNGTTVEGKLTGGTLNLDNANAQINPSVETDKNVTADATDSWALELRGDAVANVVAGKIADGVHTPKKVIESEQNAKVNILAAQPGDVTIGSDTGDRQYYIQDPQVSGSKFTSAVSPKGPASTDSETDAKISADENEYNLWLGGAAAGDSTLNTLSNLVNDSARKKLDTSYASDGASISAYAAPATGQSVYGRKVVATGTSESPFEGVNGGTAGTVTLYGAPWTGTYKPDGTVPTKDGQLFAGWYTNESAWSTENDTQKKSTDRLKKHHTNMEKPNAVVWNSTIVLNHEKYSGPLYARFVDAKTLDVTGVQLAAGSKANTHNVRFISGVDSYNFKNVTFDVVAVENPGTANAVTKTGKLTSRTAYDYVGISDKKALPPETPYTEKSGYDTTLLKGQGNASYVTVVKLSNVPDDTKITVTPSWTTLDNTPVHGTPVSFTIGTDGQVTKN